MDNKWVATKEIRQSINYREKIYYDFQNYGLKEHHLDLAVLMKNSYVNFDFLFNFVSSLTSLNLIGLQSLLSEYLIHKDYDEDIPNALRETELDIREFHKKFDKGINLVEQASKFIDSHVIGTLINNARYIYERENNVPKNIIGDIASVVNYMRKDVGCTPNWAVMSKNMIRWLNNNLVLTPNSKCGGIIHGIDVGSDEDIHVYQHRDMGFSILLGRKEDGYNNGCFLAPQMIMVNGATDLEFTLFGDIKVVNSSMYGMLLHKLEGGEVFQA